MYNKDNKEKLCSSHKHLKHTKKKRDSSQRYSNPSLLKGFMRFITNGSYGLSLEVEQLANLWFVTT